jgi:BetI-type transcriptional repressor, C-terminal
MATAMGGSGQQGVQGFGGPTSSSAAAANHFEAARRFVAMVQQERQAVLLLVDFWNQAGREPAAAAKFAERHVRLRTIERIADGVVRDMGFELAAPRDQVATALIALSNGFAIERLANHDATPDALFAHAIAAILRGFSGPPASTGETAAVSEGGLLRPSC